MRELGHLLLSRALRMAGVDRPARILVLASLAVSSAASVAILMYSFGADLPGGVTDIRAAGRLPTLLIGFSYLGLGISAATVTAAALGGRRRWARAELAFVGLLGAVIAAKTVEAADLVETYGSVGRDHDLIPSWVPTVTRTCGWIGLIAAIVIAVAPRPSSPRLARTWPLLAGLPFVLALSTWALVWLTADSVPGLSPPDGVIASAIVALVLGVGFWSSLLLLWEAAMVARGARDFGAGIATTLGRRRYVLPLLLIAKLLWLALGLSGRLPGYLGGHRTEWSAARHDGLVPWVFALTFAACAVAWLGATRSRRSEAGLEPALGAVVGGFLSMLIVAAAGIFAIGILGLAPGSAAQRFVVRATDWAGDQLLISQAIVVYLTVILGFVLWRRGKLNAATAFLLLFGVWALPRAIDVTIIEFGHESGVAALRPDLATLDAALTLAVAGLVLIARLVKKPWLRSEPFALVVLLIASALIAHGGWLTGELLGKRAFYVGLVFPFAYQFLFAADRLNRDEPGRTLKILQATGLAAALLTVVAIEVYLGNVAPEKAGYFELGRLLLAMPLALVLVATWTPPAAGTRRRQRIASAIR